MNLKDRRTQLLLITLALGVSLTSLALVKIVSEIILPTFFPSLYPPAHPLRPPPILAEPPHDAVSSFISTFYNSSPYLAPLAWIAFLLTLIWKGKIRTLWRGKGYDYDIFKVLAKTRGSDTRVTILKNLQIPKNRLQLANELGMHWESINSHIDVLIRYSLVEEMISFGTAKYLIITERGKKVLELLGNSKADQT